MKVFNPKAEGEKADEMIRELNRQHAADPAAASGDDPEAPAAEAPAAEQQDPEKQEAIAPEGEIPSADQSAPNDPAPSDEDAGDLKALNEQVQALAEKLATSDHRWKVSQGMLRQKEEENAAQREVITQLAKKEAPAPQKEETPSPVMVAPDAIDTRDYVEKFGSEYVEMITRISSYHADRAAAAVADKVVAQLTPKITELKGNVDTVADTTASTAQSLFLTSLTRLVPDYEVLDKDPNFTEWLKQTDPLVGVSKHALFHDAIQKGDANRAAAFFDGYKEFAGLATAPIADPAPDPAPVAAAAPAASGKAALVAPGKTKAAATPVQEKKQWTGDKVKKLFKQKLDGKISPEEFRRAELDIYAAQREGRFDSGEQAA